MSLLVENRIERERSGVHPPPAPYHAQHPAAKPCTQNHFWLLGDHSRFAPGEGIAGRNPRTQNGALFSAVVRTRTALTTALPLEKALPAVKPRTQNGALVYSGEFER